ncbi:efflux RND transporter permease subunit [Natronogracilivirga saccharolytica]|uniref:Efflux RND transporter permease subunit n=1 Tax=Natronogracilivirga saccharolytica TaxID=2812953 RepID=A0A8J7UXQ7_9BACT|nr:efflux RND transporter permease subunit [Natronogracilivirga saccharolytica]MBP3193599.1 efflux RND transporter permease subunit [Natronogracilivirga saccharolytica]
MKVIEQAIKNRTLIVVLAGVLIVSGLYSYITIPKESAPSIDIPLFIITTIYPGIGPSDIESLVTQPLERELQGIEGVSEIRSTSFEGFSSIVVEFDLDVENIEASQRVREQVDLARSELPSDAEEPVITEFNIDDFPIMTVNLGADYSMAQLTQIAERLEDELETISGVREVDVIGGLEREVQVNVALAALKGHNISFQQIIGAIQGQNVTIPGGNVDVDRLSYLLRVSGEFEHPDEIEDLVVFAPPAGGGGGDNDQPAPLGMIYMRDLAEVIYGFKDRESYARLTAYKVEDDNGDLIPVPYEEVAENQVVSLDIKQRSGSNILEISEDVNRVLEEFGFPSGTQIVMTNDASEDIQNLISDLENSIISGMLFVVLVLVFFLGIRNALLVGTAVPLAIFVGFLVMTIMGLTLNFVILFSLIIALGLLVDNSVVIVENIYRFRERGMERFDAAREGANEVGYALLASTATLVAAFLPLLFWPDIIGEFMSYLPMTLIIVLLCSLFIALIIYPSLTGFFVKLPTEKKRRKSLLTKISIWTGVVLVAAVVGLTNYITLIVGILIVLFFVVTYKLFVKPLSDIFTGQLLPAFIEGYKSFLTWMLQRNYKVRWAYWRNMFSLSAFTAGFLLLVLSGALSLFLGAAALPVAILGGIALVIGSLGVILHTFESVILGGIRSVIGGLVVAVVFALTLFGFSLMSAELTWRIFLIVMGIPGLVVVLGFLGMFRTRKSPIILTDNRSRLLNSTVGALFAILVVFSLVPTGVNFFPETDPNRIDINIEGPLGMNIDASNEMVREIQSRLNSLIDESDDTRGSIENVQVNVGIAATGGFGAGIPSPERARISLNMVDFADRYESSSVTMTKIREAIGEVPDALIQVEGQEIGPPTGSPVNIEISGDDFRQVERITSEVRQRLQDAEFTGSIPGLVDVRDNVSGGLPEYNLRIDHEKARKFGLTLSDIAQTVRIAVNGLDASTFRDGEDEYDIVVRLREEDRDDLDKLRDLTINQAGMQVPLVSVADFEEAAGPGSISRLNLQRTAVVEADAAAGFSGPQVLSQVQDYLADYRQDLPAGYTMEYTGESEDQEESFSFLTTALVISFALIFLVLLAKFNSLIIPFIISIAVGLSLIGVFLGLIVTRTEFNVMVFVGIISLAGIVCINNIVLVEYIKQMLDSGKSKMDAIVEAGAIRLRPVLLTALTTILGLVPLTFGIDIDYIGLLTQFDPAFQLGTESTQFWGPMGITIISGLMFATFLTLVIVPVMYSVFDSLSKSVAEAYRSRD